MDRVSTSWLTRAGVMLCLLATACEGVSRGELPCQGQQIGVWRVSSSDGGNLEVSIDTVSRLSTFDPVFNLVSVGRWSDDPREVEWSGLIAAGDDEFECTYPPRGDGLCPEVSANVKRDVGLWIASLGGCADPSLAVYQITATLDGEPVKLDPLGVVRFNQLDLYSFTYGYYGTEPTEVDRGDTGYYSY